MHAVGEGESATDHGQRLISVDRVAELLDVSVRTVWRLRSAGQIPEPVKLGRSIRWNAAELSTWIERGCPKM
jgi:excisionase family DNA binding protein